MYNCVQYNQLLVKLAGKIASDNLLVFKQLHNLFPFIFSIIPKKVERVLVSDLYSFVVFFSKHQKIMCKSVISASQFNMVWYVNRVKSNPHSWMNMGYATGCWFSSQHPLWCCFRLVSNTGLITCQCFGYCWIVIVQFQSLFCFPLWPYLSE